MLEAAFIEAVEKLDLADADILVLRIGALPLHLDEWGMRELRSRVQEDLAQRGLDVVVLALPEGVAIETAKLPKRKRRR